MINKRRGLRGARTRVVGVLAATAMLGLVGCHGFSEVPIVSGADYVETSSLNELRAWVEKEFDRSIAASGIPDGWFADNGAGYEVAWDTPENRARNIGSLLPNECGPGRAGQLNTGLMNRNATEDPFVVAERVWKSWEARGWQVNYVGSGASETEAYFRADREDGAHLSFRAQESWFVLGVNTVCSGHVTVSHWDLITEEPNVYADELERR